MNIYSGTSGYGYKEWKGTFYPEKISPKEMLRFYGERFRTVEINNTFYRLPTGSVLASWAEQVPLDFIFAIKAPQKITHLKRLRNVAEETGYLFRSLSILERKLGPVLFQFPKTFQADYPTLEAFLDLLPGGISCAFEFRSPSWLQAKMLDLLRGKELQPVHRPIRMKTRPKRSSARRPGGTCACAVPITPLPISPVGWKGFFRKNGRRPSSILNTKMKP